MRDLDEKTLTDEVLRRFDATRNPRLRLILQSLTRHLHAFVREAEPSEAEWGVAIDFLTRTGQISSATRQEFILLSDVFGVSMLVDAINHRDRDDATATTVLGPFFVDDAPAVANGADITGGAQGVPLHVTGRVSSTAGPSLPGARVEVWHSDAEGSYDVQRTDLDARRLRARLSTDDDGAFSFWSILPTPYAISHDGPVGELLRASGRHPWRPAHLHFMISAHGHEKLVTHLFVAGDQWLDSDAVFGVKRSLIDAYPVHAPGRAPDGRVLDCQWRSLDWHFRLKPDR